MLILNLKTMFFFIPLLVQIINSIEKYIKYEKHKKKALQSTFVLKSDKETDYIYKLSNGTYLSFPSKQFPTNQNTNTNQLLLF